MMKGKSKRTLSPTGNSETLKHVRSLLNTNSREVSEITIETVRMNNCVIMSQVTKKLHEIKLSLNSQIVEAINSAIAEQFLPSIQNSLGSRKCNLDKNWT